MILIDIVKTDWIDRLPYHLRFNRYCGFARTCFQILVILYYCVKSLILLLFSFYYFFYRGIFLVVRPAIIYIYRCVRK